MKRDATLYLEFNFPVGRPCGLWSHMRPTIFSNVIMSTSARQRNPSIVFLVNNSAYRGLWLSAAHRYMKFSAKKACVPFNLQPPGTNGRLKRNVSRVQYVLPIL